jgi:glycosyltransferase involved in cell wall biosynthesis
VNENIESKVERIKKLLNELVEKGELDYALEVINKCENVIKNDAEIISMKGIIYYAKNEIEKAEEIFKKGLLIDPTYADFYYNLGCIYELKEEYEKAAKFFARALEFATGKETIEVGKKLNNILCKISTPLKNETKIAFFVKPGLDSFLNDIILGLMDEYFVRKITVTDFKQIDEGMQWADICWFEWCDELVIYGSRHELARKKKVICRIHGYEVYTSYIEQPDYTNIDKVIFVTNHVKNIFEEKVNIEDSKKVVIHCGVDVSKFPFKKRKKGYNIGYLGYINFKKNIPLTLHIFREVYKIDNRYKLHIAGQFQDERTKRFFEYFIKENKLENNVVFYGWLENEEKIKWFDNIDYMLISSIDEGLCFAAAEAMLCGIKPVLHNCEGIKEHYVEDFIFNSVNEAVEMILSEDYDSTKYRAFIESNYSLERQNNKIRNLIEELAAKHEDLSIDIAFNNMWDSIWNNYSRINISDILNEPSGMTLRSEFISLLSKFFILKNAKILEVGCGSGAISLDLSLRGAMYTGIDISYEAIRLAKHIANDYKIVNCEYTYGNGFNLVYPDNSYDISFNIGVLEHFNDNDIVKMLKEMARVSKFVIVGIPYSGSQIYRLAKKISQSNDTWEYGFERDFKSFEYLAEKAGLYLLHEEVIGYVSEAYYLKRINPQGIQALIAENVTKLFNKEKNVGNWLIAVMTKNKEYKNLFMSLNDEKKICFSGGDICVIKKSLPNVSVVIPFFNAQKYANRIIDNISQIEYPDLEFVFVDDGSTDSTRELLMKLSKEVNKEIKIVSLEKK